VIALVADPVRARRFVATALEPLAPALTRRWAVPTVQAYLACQGRLKEVAAELGVHHNTVKYRLAELRPLLDEIAADGHGAATLLLALRVQHYLAEGNG
jgi:DNA-binding PucR family transcriptional regulator